MESFLNRYRNITVLLLVIFAQLILLAVQVKNDQDVRVIRVWAVTAVTPAARVVEFLRGGGVGFFRNYILLRDQDAQNRRLQSELGRLKLENNFLKNELSTAERGKALALFQERAPSRMLAATVFGSGAGPNSNVRFVDRGSSSGVMRGMAVVTPDGIVGKVIAAYPTASEVLLITDADFAAGVVSQKGQVRGTLKGQGKPLCLVDYVPFEEKVEPGEWFYTSGADRIFPRGHQVGVVKAVRAGQPYKEIYVEPSALQHELEEVLIITEGVHQDIPDTAPTNQPVYIGPPPPGGNAAERVAAEGPSAAPGTEADKLRTSYKAIGDAQNHKFGEGLPGTKPPDFNLKLPQPGTASPATAPGGPAPGAVLPPRQPAPGGPAPGTVQPPRQPAPAAHPPALNPPPAPAKGGDGAPHANPVGGQPGGPPR